MSKNKNIIEGRILSFDESPFNKDFDVSSLKVDKKRIFIIDGIIDSIGPANVNRHDFRDVEVVDYGNHLISAGFVMLTFIILKQLLLQVGESVS